MEYKVAEETGSIAAEDSEKTSLRAEITWINLKKNLNVEGDNLLKEDLI